MIIWDCLKKIVIRVKFGASDLIDQQLVLF